MIYKLTSIFLLSATLSTSACEENLSLLKVVDNVQQLRSVASHSDNAVQLATSASAQDCNLARTKYKKLATQYRDALTHDLKNSYNGKYDTRDIYDDRDLDNSKAEFNKAHDNLARTCTKRDDSDRIYEKCEAFWNEEYAVEKRIQKGRAEIYSSRDHVKVLKLERKKDIIRLDYTMCISKIFY